MAMPLDALAARRVYDRIGRLQGSQHVYEDIATDRLTQEADFGGCTSLFELGCGTGRYAARLLESALPSTATYLGVDVSPKMVALSCNRLAPWSDRARVVLLDPPALKLPADTGAFDRFVATYVFDLLSQQDGEALLGEAARLLAPGGLLGVVSLTKGTTIASRIVSSGWEAVAKRWPSLLGGCQPIELRDLISGPAWAIEKCDVAVKFAVPSEVVIARRVGG